MKRPPLFLRFFWIFLMGGILSSCSFFKEPVVLQVGSKQWTARAFSKRLAQDIRVRALLRNKNPKDPLTEDIKSELSKIKEALISDLLLQYLIQRWSKAQGVFVSEEELKKEIDKIKKPFVNDKAFNWYLKKTEASRKQWEQKIKTRILSQKLMKNIGEQMEKPSLEEMKFYYRNRLNLFKKGPRIFIRHGFHKEKEKLSVLRAKWILGERPKTFLGQKSSQMVSTQWVKKGTLEVFDRAFALKIGEISPIWQSDYGYHLIELLEKKPAEELSFESARKSIRQKLFLQKQKALYIKWVDEQSQSVRVWKNEKALAQINIKIF